MQHVVVEALELSCCLCAMLLSDQGQSLFVFEGVDYWHIAFTSA